MKTTTLELLQSSDMSSAAVTAVERKAKPAEPATCTVEAFEKLVAQHGLAGSFHIPNAVREELQSQLGLDSTRMLHLCMKMVQPRAVAPVSNFHVGAAALGETGDVHMGVNLEFKNNPLTNTMHAEQFLVLGCLQRGETKLVELATSAPPCGYCRQFLNEMIDGSKMVVCCRTCNETAGEVGSRYTLGELLPKSFGPADLFPARDESNDIFSSSRHNGLSLTSCGNETLAEAAVAAANRSYCPYTHKAAGVAFRTQDGSIHSGWSIENAAFNPTLSPLHNAIVALMCSNGGRIENKISMGSSIAECVLVEGSTQAGVDWHASSSSTSSSSSMWHATVAQVMASLAPEAKVRFLRAHAHTDAVANVATPADVASTATATPVVRTPNLSALPSTTTLSDLTLVPTMSPSDDARRLSSLMLTRADVNALAGKRKHISARMSMDAHALIAPHEKAMATVTRGTARVEPGRGVMKQRRLS